MFFEKKEKFDYWGVPIGILFFFCFLALGLLFVVHFRPLYYWSMDWMDLELNSGFSQEVIRENYDALIDYCSPFYRGTLNFPSMAASANGLSHFAEVKVIFNMVYLLGAVSFVSLGVIIFFKKRKNEFCYFLSSSITTAGIPVLLGLASVINYNAVFTLFHKLMFANDDWIFDETLDPIIRVLPESYFMLCTFILCTIILLGALILYLIYYYKTKNRKKRPFLSTPKNYYY